MEADSERINRLSNVESPVTREAYEKACKIAGVEIYSDEQITGEISYALKYGEFNLPEYSAQTIIKFNLARLRMYVLEDEKKRAQEKKQRQEPNFIACPNCGALTTKNNLMSASLGVACPACYDEMSN
jgi:DNA-directed RNA polymerase subunit RPC12/RpoP